MSNALNKMTTELWKLRTNSNERKKTKRKILKSHWGNQRNELCILSTVRYFAHVNYTDRNEIYMHYCTNECRWVRKRMCACVHVCALCVVSERAIVWMYTYMDMFKWTGMEIFEIPNHRWKRVSSLIRSTLSYTLQTLDLMVRWHQILLNKNRDTLRSSHKGKSTILTVPKTFENE